MRPLIRPRARLVYERIALEDVIERAIRLNKPIVEPPRGGTIVFPQLEFKDF